MEAKMKQLIIPIVASLILVAWAIQMMRSKTYSPRRDLAYIAVIALLIAVY
jgi:hypothetical protein